MMGREAGREERTQLVNDARRVRGKEVLVPEVVSFPLKPPSDSSKGRSRFRFWSLSSSSEEGRKAGRKAGREAGRKDGQKEGRQ
jgi:hypothetical protein